MTDTLILASRSPRRKAILEEAGWTVVVRPAAVDDGELSGRHRTADAWTTAMAWLKARDVRAHLEGPLQDPVVAGDTVCMHEGRLLGQPATAAEAGHMLRGMRGATHSVCTGLCVLLPSLGRRFGVDAAAVHIGDLGDAEIDAYLASGAWRGKAGGYNLQDRVDAGWPITWEGDASTIMGMPVPLLRRLLENQAP